MNQAMQFLDKLRNDPKAKELVTDLKMPESEEETADRRGDGYVKKKSIHADIIPKDAQSQ